MTADGIDPGLLDVLFKWAVQNAISSSRKNNGVELITSRHRLVAAKSAKAWGRVREDWSHSVAELSSAEPKVPEGAYVLKVHRGDRVDFTVASRHHLTFVVGRSCDDEPGSSSVTPEGRARLDEALSECSAMALIAQTEDVARTMVLLNKVPPEVTNFVNVFIHNSHADYAKCVAWGAMETGDGMAVGMTPRHFVDKAVDAPSDSFLVLILAGTKTKLVVIPREEHVATAQGGVA